ncbi:MAG TPA: hypothetical protein VK877_14190 [Pseudolabrys sp.]|nr:hypothetical protein [Pseudolabrys sp.]
MAEPLDSVARDCDFTEFFVSDVRLAATLGPEAASNNTAAIATMWNLAIVIFITIADFCWRPSSDDEKRCVSFAAPVESLVRYGS